MSLRYEIKAGLAVAAATVVAGGIGYGDVAWSQSIDAKRAKESSAPVAHFGDQAKPARPNQLSQDDPWAMAAMLGTITLLGSGTVAFLRVPEREPRHRVERQII